MAKKLSEQPIPDEWIKRMSDAAKSYPGGLGGLHGDCFLLGVQYAEQKGCVPNIPKCPDPPEQTPIPIDEIEEIAIHDMWLQKVATGTYSSRMTLGCVCPVSVPLAFRLGVAFERNRAVEEAAEYRDRYNLARADPSEPPLQNKEQRAGEIVRRLRVLSDICNNLSAHDGSWIIGLYEKLGLGYEGDCGPTDEEFASQLSLCDKMHIERLYGLWVGNTNNRKGDNGQKED